MTSRTTKAKRRALSESQPRVTISEAEWAEILCGTSSSLDRALNRLIARRAAATPQAAEIAPHFATLEFDPAVAFQSIDYVLWDGLPVRLERWQTEHMPGASVVLRSEDAAAMTDAELADWTRRHLGDADVVGIKRRAEFTFLSYRAPEAG